jgi:hypothetical protein
VLTDAGGLRRSASVNRLSRAGWLDRDRIVAWSGILLAVEVLFLGFVVLWQHGVFGPLGPTTTDFVSFYDAGMYSADNLAELSRGLGRYV